MKAGALRHRVDFLEPVRVQDPVTGDLSTTWATVASGVPAEVVPLSVREFVAARTTTSEISARVVIRHRPGLRADMRVQHDGKLYQIAGILADPSTGRDYLTLPVSEVAA